MNNWKNPAVWGMAGALLGGAAAVALNSQQISQADQWGSVGLAIGSGVVAFIAAFLNAIRKKG